MKMLRRVSDNTAKDRPDPQRAGYRPILLRVLFPTTAAEHRPSYPYW